MIFELETREVNTVGVLERKEITLSGNAKAFRIIFGQIYPNIIKAIVRELFANAWDSHKVADNLSTPIDIHIPNLWEPYFEIRDYGTGMSPETIDKIYSVVFESTKDKNNDEAGMFGMGSKTPLGYADSFGLISFYNGTYYAYDIYIGPNGSPIIDLKATGETTEPNGVRVTVGVKEQDFEEFRTFTDTFILGADIDVNINGERWVNRPKVYKRGEDWVIYDNLEGFFVRMGCILYRVNREFFMYKHQTNLVIDFPIGTFEVTGSREDIKYDDVSKELLSKRFGEIKEEVFGLLEKDINNLKKYADFHEFSKNTIHWIDSYRLSEKVNDIKKKKYGKIVNKYSSTFEKFYVTDGGYVRRFKDSAFNSMHYTSSNISSKLNKLNSYGEYKNVYIIVSYYKDNVRNTNSRIKSILESGKNEAYIIRCRSEYHLKRLMVLFPNNYILVNLIDIEPSKNTIVREKATVDQAWVVDGFNEIGKVKRPTYCKEMASDKYYILADKIYKYKDLEKILSFLDIRYSSVYIIPKSKVSFISKYNLKYIYDVFDMKKEDCVYSEEDLLSFVIMYGIETNQDYSSRDRKKSSILQSSHNEEFVRGMFPNYKFKPLSNVKDIIPDINEGTFKKFEEIRDEVTSKIDQFMEKHKVLEFIDGYYLGNKFKEIMETLGEKT